MSLNAQSSFKQVSDTDEFPQGFYRDAKCLGSRQELKTAFEGEVIPAIRRRREVRICDTADYLCFHSKDGRILYPPRPVAEASTARRF